MNPRQLTQLRSDVENGTLTETDLKQMVEAMPSKIASRIREFLYTGNLDTLTMSPREALKTWLYQTHVLVGEPVMSGGQILPSPSAEKAAPEFPSIYSRPMVMQQGMKVLYWHDEPVRTLDLEGKEKQLVKHAPATMEWDDEIYTLVAETQKKSFYFPLRNIPEFIRPWLTAMPQSRSDLATGLKRQGQGMDSLKGIVLSEDHIFTHPVPVKDSGTVDVNDLGVLVLDMDRWSAMQEELEIRLFAQQCTIWFADGSYFKGTITNTNLANMPSGFYGGIKRPEGANSNTISIFGGVMDEYVAVPWSSSINRQQTDYADLTLPVRPEFPDPEVFAKATTGFPSYVEQLNSQLISQSRKLFSKARISGYSGKWSITSVNEDVQFVVRTNAVEKDEIRTMVFLFSPSLPVHEGLLRVKVLFKADPDMDGHLLMVNVHENNHEWLARNFICLFGRDADGDGGTLTDDPEVFSKAKDEVPFIDTTAYKSMADMKTQSPTEAVRTAAARIRANTGLIGKIDKLARRIHYLKFMPEFKNISLSWDLRTQLTEGIQRAISAQKKNSGADRFAGYHWILQLLPEEVHELVLPNDRNPHDQIDALKTLAKDWLKTRAAYANDPNHGAKRAMLNAEITYLKALDAVKDIMPKHFAAAQSLLKTMMPVDDGMMNRLRVRGRTLFESAQASMSDAELTELFNVIERSKHLWRSIRNEDENDDNPVLTYAEAARIIENWVTPLAEKHWRATVGAMITEFSLSLLGYLLTLEDLAQIGYANELVLPIQASVTLVKGMRIDRSIAERIVLNPGYLALMEQKYYTITKITRSDDGGPYTITINKEEN